MAHRKNDSDGNRFPERAESGTRYDLEPLGPKRTRRLPPTMSLFQVKGAPRFVCIIWGDDVQPYVAEFRQTGRSHVTGIPVRRITPANNLVALHTRRGIINVPAPGIRGDGTWGDATLIQRDVANFDIERDAAGKIVSIQPKG